MTEYKKDEHDFAKDCRQVPETLTVLGKSPEDGSPEGYYQCDRALHTHLLGRTGGGKSTLLENIALQDMRAGRGGLYLDPHGDSAERLAAAAPAEAVQEGRVVYLDFGAEDKDLPALNPFEVEDVTSAESRQDAVDRAVDLLRRTVTLDENAVRLMKYLSKGLQTLAFIPEEEGSVHGGATLLDLMPLFLNSGFREYAKRFVTDRSLRDWWSQSYESMSSSKVVEETMSLEGRLAPILCNLHLAAVIGEPRNTLDLAKAMDDGTYVIVNLAKAKTSDTFRKLVGSTLVSQVCMAALGRQRRMREEDRRRFNLFIDEFQNFLSSDFSAMLEEARKYGLAITIANQSMGQLEGEPRLVKTLATNIGNRIVYGVGYDDAQQMEPFMAPFTAATLMGLPAHHIAVRLMHDHSWGTPASELVTLPPDAAYGDEWPPVPTNGLKPLRPGTPVGSVHDRDYPVLPLGGSDDEYVVL